MSYGYTFDEEMRKEITQAVKKYEEDGDYVALNKVIMKVQQPLKEKLDKILEILK